MGAKLAQTLDGSPNAGLRNVTWESEFGLYDLLRWTALNVTPSIAAAVVRNNRRNRDSDLSGQIEDGGLAAAFAVPINIIVQSRTLRVSADVVTLERRIGGESFEDIMKSLRETPEGDEVEK